MNDLCDLVGKMSSGDDAPPAAAFGPAGGMLSLRDADAALRRKNGQNHQIVASGMAVTGSDGAF